MWQVSDKFLATCARTHSTVTKIEILKNGNTYAFMQAGLISDPASGMPLYGIDGSIQVSRTAIRRACRITLVDPSGQLVPEHPDDLLAPYVTEIRVWSGVRYWDSPQPAVPTTNSGLGSPTVLEDVEYVPVGTFVITQLESQYPSITITGSDRMWYLANFAAPYAVSSGTKVVDALRNLLSAHVPSPLLDMNFSDEGGDASAGNLSYDANSSSSEAAGTIAGAASWVVYADQMGVFVGDPEPSTDDDPALILEPGAGTLLLRPHRTIGAADVTNAVVFTNESGTVALRGYAQDNNPNSITYVGRIGVRPAFQSSPLMTTQAMVNKAARTALQNQLGLATTWTVPILPMPALDAGDVIHVTDPTQGLDENLLIDSFPVNLTSKQPMELTCRAQVVR